MSLVKGAKISSVTKTTAITTERVHISNPSDRYATGVNNTKLQNEIDFFLLRNSMYR